MKTILCLDCTRFVRGVRFGIMPYTAVWVLYWGVQHYQREYFGLN